MSFKPLNRGINPWAFAGIAFDLVGGEKQFSIRPNEFQVQDIIIEAVLDVFNTSIDKIKEKGRSQKIRQARQIMQYYLREYTTLSLSDIGKQTGRDHATVLYSCKTVIKDISVSKDVEVYVNKVRSAIAKKAKTRRVKIIL